MIAGCPTCAARYRIDTAKLRPEGARLRCSRCETVFRVRPPAEPSSAAPAARAALAPARAERPLVRPNALPPDPARLVLIAHPEPHEGKALADALATWGLSPLLVHDGVEAILQIQRSLPRVVVLDAALPKMFGFQICELMKRNAELRSIPVVLVGAIHDQDRYRRPPEELYGADAYVERHQLPDALAAHLARFGIAFSGPATYLDTTPTEPEVVRAPADPVPAARVPQGREAAAQRGEAERSVGPREGGPGTSPSDPATDNAQRLARIIVSDVILYNQQKFDVAVRAGNVLQALASELEEGYSLFAQRIDSRRFDPREFIQRELVRVARSRGMK